MQCKLAKVDRHDIVYDLGCGDGTALIVAAKEFGASGVGIEIDLPRYLIAQMRIRLNGVSDRVKIYRKNFFAFDISPASVVIMYLIPKTLERLKPKLLKETKPGTRVVTFVYKISLPLKYEDKVHEIYIYEIPKR